MTTTRYDNVAVALHWVIALAIIANIALGLYFGDLPRSDPGKFQLAQIHKSIGLSVLVLSLARVGWRLSHPVPPLPEDMSAMLRLLARTTQFLLYVLIVAIPLSGWAMASASPFGLPTRFFGLVEWPQIAYFADMTRAQKMPLHERLEDLHALLAWSAIVLVPIYVAGALYHQFVRRDAVVARMLPGLSRGVDA